jgi:hypothetical protein
MTQYAWVHADLNCPECGHVLVNRVWLEWGGMLSADPNAGPTYVVGDRLLWFSDARGIVHADSTLPDSRGSNVGDPRLTDVDVYSDRESRGFVRTVISKYLAHACLYATVLFGV